MGDLPAGAHRRFFWVSVAFVVLVSMCLALLPITPVYADHGVGGQFDGTDGMLDPGAINLVDVCGTGDDDVLRNGDPYKLFDVHTASTPPSVVVLGNVPGKADICDVWLATENVGDDIYLYLAWDRYATSGSAVFAFEFQQHGVTCVADPADPNETCNPFAHRQVGDFLIIYDFQGNSIRIGKRTFDGSGFGALVPLAEADFEASLSADTSFGEAVINLTGEPPIIPTDPAVCLTVANIIPMTITGNSDRAEVMDLVIDDLSDEIGISNCGTLEVIKATDPPGLSGTFDITVDGSELSSPLAGTLTGDGDVETFADLFAATDYSLVEIVPAGWEPTYTVACELEDGTVTGAGTDIEIEINATTTCVITNTVIPPRLTLLKEVVNDNGGTAVDTDWQLTATGPVTATGVEGDAAVTDAEVAVGTYELSESGPAGYGSLGWVCNGVAGDTVTLNPGDEVTCSVTNDDLPAHLTLIKLVDNNAGGDAEATDWTLQADGPTPISGAGGADADVDAGTYVLSESGGPDGYEPGEWACVGGEQVGNQVTLGLGDSATCTIVNDDIAPLLTLEKEVINDDGGSAVDTDFTLSASGPLTVTGPEGHAMVTGIGVLAGTYVLSETGPDGYENLGWSCDGGSLIGDELTLGLGDVVVCTVINDDMPASLTLVKEVINDDGGAALSTDWTLSADGPTPLSGATGSDAVTDAAVDPGTYLLGETGPAGYSAGEWVCDGGTLVGDAVTIALGDDVVCSIVNDDIPATLRLVKQVINNDGGIASPDDWTLTADGPVVVQGSGQATATVPAGAYDLSESGPSGYVAGAWECTGGLQAGSTITVPLAGDVTCTIRNDDIAPSLTVIKVVATGDAQPDDFALTVDGEPVLSGVAVAVDANVSHTVSESLVTGYVQTGFACIDDDSQEQVEHPVTMESGGSVTCTITNNELGSITVVKQALPGGGEFSFTLDPGDTQVVSGDSGTFTWSDLAPGAYDLTETTPVDWSLEEVACDADVEPLDTGASVELSYGQHVTCVFTNGLAPTLTVVKATTITTDAEFAFTLGDDGFELGAGESQTFTLTAGTHEVTELVPEGWRLDDITCDGPVTAVDDGVSVALAFGDDVTCTFTNSQLADIAVTKADLEDPVVLTDEIPVGTIVYTLEVTNNGPANATNVVATDTLAASTTFVSAVPSQGSCDAAGGVVTCALGDLAVGQSATITITVLTADIADVSTFLVINTVEVQADQVDVDPTNNTAVEETVLVAVLPLPPIAPPVLPQVPQLPATGLATEELGLLAATLIGLGAMLVRRRDESSGLE